MLKNFSIVIGLFLLVTIFIGGIANKSELNTSQLTVWSSYLLKEPFMEINGKFEKVQNCQVVYGRAPEATLAKDISKFDFTADVIATRSIHLKAAKERLHRTIEVLRPLCEGRWVIITLKESPANIRTIEDLANPGLKVAFCAKRTEYNDFSAVTVAKLVDNSGIKEEFCKNIPEGVDCGGVCALVLSAVKAPYFDYEAIDRNSYYWQVFSQLEAAIADVCIVDEIFARKPEVKDRIKMIPVDDKLFPEGSTTFGIGTTTYSKHKDLAQKYISFIFSPDGKTIFEKYNLKLIE